MGIAIEEDESADLKRAEMYFAGAVKLEHDNPAYWVDYGSYLFKIGKSRAALRALRKAYAIDNTNSDIVGQVAETLRREGQDEEATKLLQASLFASHGADSIRRLWRSHQFALLHARQQQPDADLADLREVILPFRSAPTQGKYVDLGGRTIRIDPPETLKEPAARKPVPYKRPPKG
jgi:predicted Zn-dependent protease